MIVAEVHLVAPKQKQKKLAFHNADVNQTLTIAVFSSQYSLINAIQIFFYLSTNILNKNSK